MELIRVNWKIILFEGIILALLGLIALAFPFFMAVSMELLLGALFLVAGFAQAWRALTHFKQAGAVPLLVGAALSVIVGVLLLAFPLTGVLTLTLLLAVFFVLDGVAKIASSLQHRQYKGWGWLLFSGIVSLLLAALIFSGLPVSAVWVLGIYLGVYFLFVGISLIMLSTYIKGGEISGKDLQD